MRVVTWSPTVSCSHPFSSFELVRASAWRWSEYNHTTSCWCPLQFAISCACLWLRVIISKSKDAVCLHACIGTNRILVQTWNCWLVNWSGMCACASAWEWANMRTASKIFPFYLSTPVNKVLKHLVNSSERKWSDFHVKFVPAQIKPLVQCLCHTFTGLCRSD